MVVPRDAAMVAEMHIAFNIARPHSTLRRNIQAAAEIVTTATAAIVNWRGEYFNNRNLSGAPQIENPQADPGTFVNASYYGTSQLGHDSAWSGQVMVSVSFALFGP